MNLDKIRMILQILFIVISMLLFLASHLLQASTNYVGFFKVFGFNINCNFFIDTIFIISYFLLFVVIISIILEVLKKGEKIRLN